jgi:hypothetical protein
MIFCLTRGWKMDFLRLHNNFFLALFIAVMCIIQPVLAQDGSPIISYRGSGGYYLGDTIVFDGKTTVGTPALLKISGPGLPREGVPVYDLNGVPGSGNTVPVNEDGTWRFVWYSASIAGSEKIRTARYTITAFDLTNPEKTASVTILLKMPDSYISPQQHEVKTGDYVQLNGITELGVTELKIDIADSNGTILRSYTSPVSGSGYFNYGFRADVQPGEYFVSVSNPAMKEVLRTTITVVPPEETPLPATTTFPISTPSESVSVAPTPLPNLTQPVASSPSAIPLSPIITISGLMISGTIILVWSNRRRKQ